MKRRIPMMLAGMLACSATLAAGQVLRVDSPAAASRALAVAFDADEGVRYPWQTMVDEARQVAARTLAILDAGTTPAQATQGVTLACPLSGTLTAKLSRLPLRYLSITWDDCASSVEDDAIVSLDGAGELVLGANSFAPGFLLLIKLGEPDQRFVETWRADASQSEREERVFGLAAIGRIPLTLANGVYTGPFSFALDGELEWRYVSSEPAAPVSRSISTADNLVVRGAATWRDDPRTLEEDLTVSGSARVLQLVGSSSPELQHRFTARDFRVHRVSRPGAPYFDTLTVDGKIDYLWTPGGVDGCGDGRYSFRTLVPVMHGLNGALQSFTQGQIVLNGAATATFSPADGPALPDWYVPGPGERATLVSIDMGDPGVYEHTSFAPLVTLPVYDGCFN
jgi:hypothetical protein